MNLKTRFTLLIFGAIIIPMLVMGTAFWIFNNYMSVTDPVWVARNFQDRLENMSSSDDFPELLEEMGDSYFAIMVEKPELISSTDPEDIIYSRTPGKEDRAPRLLISSQLKELDDGREVFIIFGMNLFDVNGRVFPLLFLGSTAIVLIVLSLVIIRSINNSIAKLERATVRIAEGDLNVSIDTRGQDRFGSLARSLDTMRHQIKMEYDRRNRFFMGISHDLKTPLSSITGYADALSEGMADDREAMEKYLGIIRDKSHQLEQRITHLIHYLKLSNYDFQASLDERPLAPFLNSFLEVQMEDAGFHHHRLEGNIKITDELRIHFDEDLLRRALENLIQNAFRYGSEDDPVHFDCYNDNQTLFLIVENRGTAIPEEQLEHIFEPFFRGDKARRGEGFGLGLASVRSIIDSHGWEIGVESSESRTRFVIKILL